MSAAEVDTYLAAIEQPKRTTLEALRRSILEVVPDAEEGMAYGVPAFRLGDKVIAGFAAAKGHLSYFPHSGWVVAQMEADLSGYSTSKGTVRFPVDQSLPAGLVRRLIEVRLHELEHGRR